MGGQGSGNWCRWNNKTTTEDCKQIDIRLMNRKGWLNPGLCGSLSWKWNGEPWGDIRYECHYQRLMLNFRYRANGSEWESVSQSVPITNTQCNYGSSRQWFSCPNCGYRCAILYCAGKLFLCRNCYDLPYDSQMKSDLDRLIGQKHKLGNFIFDDYQYGEGWFKRKGMHQKTFNRLYFKYKNLDNLINTRICEKFSDNMVSN